MAGKHRFWYFLILLPAIFAMYEDQAGKFDWRQQYVGRVDHIHWEQHGSTNPGKRFIVGTERNVLACIHALNGSIAWRKLFEESSKGRLDAFLYNGDTLVTVVGGRKVNSWNSGTGNLVWESYLPGNEDFRAVASLSGKSKGSLAVVMTAEGVYGLGLNDGKQKWDMTLPERTDVNYQYILIAEGTIYVVGVSLESYVKVVAMDMEGSVLSQKRIPAAWLTQNTRCSIGQEKYLICYSQSSDTLYSANVMEAKSFVPSALQDLGVNLESVSPENVDQLFYQSSPKVILRLERNHLAVVHVNDQGIRLTKDLPKVSAAQIVMFEEKEILMTLGRVSSTEMVLAGYDLQIGVENPDLSQKIPAHSHHGSPVLMSSLLITRKDGKMSYRIIVTFEDYAIHLVQKSGKISWRREESLAYSIAVEMVDLPVSEIEAQFEDEFGSQQDNIMTMFVKRIKTQLLQLQTFIEEQIHHLQGHRHHIPDALDSTEDEDEEELVRDQFSLHKMVVIVSASGKIFGMRSNNGHIVWEHFIPDLSPFTSFGKKKLLLYVQRTTAHFPYPPQCLIVGKNKRSGRGHLFAFNPITGQAVEGVPPGGIHLTHDIVQSYIVGEMDGYFIRPVIFMDENNQIHTYPQSCKPFVKQIASSLFMYLTDMETGVMNGYKIVSSENILTTNKVWSLNLQKKDQVITNIVGKRGNEHVHSQGRVLGDRSVLYKYLNPNVVVVTTEGMDMASPKGPSNFFNLFVVDTVTGHIVFHLSHRRAKGPVHVIHSENWVVYNYFNQKHRRNEMAVLEMYEGKEQSNSSSFSSFTAIKQPLVLRQSYIFPMPISTIATTITEKGITSKHIIVALKAGWMFALPKLLLDPRRPLIPSQETMEEGTIPYIPELPVHTEGVINYNQTVFNVRDIHTSPTGLESTSLVLSYGLDLFCTKVMPSKMFDVLKEDFDYLLIGSVLLAMILVSFITQKLASRKALNRAWK